MTSWSDPVAGAPQRAIARVEALQPQAIRRLIDAFEGPGRPVGVLGVRRDGASLAVEFDAAITTPDLIAAVIAAETHTYRRFERATPWPADDAALTALCSDVLAEPDLDTSRLIETYLIPMLNESS